MDNKQAAEAMTLGKFVPNDVATYNLGFQAGLKKAAEIAMETVKGKPIPYAVLKGAKAIEQAILKAANGD